MFYSNGKFTFTERTVTTNIDMTGGYWRIGDDPATNAAGVATAKVAETLPHKIQEWKYWDDVKWQTDPLLTVTGNIVILRSLY